LPFREVNYMDWPPVMVRVPVKIPTFISLQGCVDVMNDWIDEHMIIILAVGVSLGILQLILLILGLWFCQSIGDYEEQKDEDGHSAM